MQLILSTYTHKCFTVKVLQEPFKNELFLMSKFLNYVRGKYDHEIVEKKIHILQMYLIYFEKQNKFNVYTFHKVETYL